MYTKVESTFWTDEKVLELSATARYLMLYILTSPHRNVLGLFFLPEPYMCFDTGLNQEQFNQGFKELLDKGLIKYDFKTKIILVRNFLKYNPIENPNQTKSAIDKLIELPQTELLNDFTEIIRYLSQEKGFLKPLLERLEERLCKGLPQPVNSNQYTVNIINDDDTRTSADNPVKKEEPKANGVKAISFAEHQWGRLISPGEIDNIVSWCDKFYEAGSEEADEIVIEAIKRCTKHNIKTMGYLDSILRNWNENGVTKVLHITELDEKFNKAKKEKGKGPRSPDPKPPDRPKKDKYENIYL